MRRIVGGMLRWSERHPLIFTGLVLLSLSQLPFIAANSLGAISDRIPDKIVLLVSFFTFCLAFLFFPIALCRVRAIVNAPRGFSETYTEHLTTWANK